MSLLHSSKRFVIKGDAMTVRTPGALPLAAVVATAALLAGCSTAPTGSSGDQIAITLAMQNPDVETADPATWAIVEAFEDANPDVDVVISGQPVAEHLQSLTIAAQSDTLPNIFWVYKSTALDMLDAGLLLDLGPLLDENDISGSLPPSTIESYTEGDAVFGVPYQQLLTGLWVNGAILAEHGLETPTTFEELLEVSAALRAAGVTTIANGANQSSFSVWSFLAAMDRFGITDRIDAILAGDEPFGNDDMLAYYGHIAELADAGAFADNVSTQTYQQAVDSFINGNAAMLDAGVWAASAIQDTAFVDDVEFWAGPQFSDGVGPQNTVMNVAAAPLAVDHKVGDDPELLDAVTRFLTFYYSDEAQQILVDNGQPPVTLYDAEIDSETQHALDVALETAANPELVPAGAQPDLLVPTSVANAMYDSIYGVIQRQLTPEQAIDLVQRAIDDL